jgi:hypothetical protein
VIGIEKGFSRTLGDAHPLLTSPRDARRFTPRVRPWPTAVVILAEILAAQRREIGSGIRSLNRLPRGPPFPPVPIPIARASAVRWGAAQCALHVILAAIRPKIGSGIRHSGRACSPAL